MSDSLTARRHVIPNACNECRKKRTKCDGELPCSRCESRQGLVCVYEPHLKQTKEVLQAELVRVRKELRSMDAVLKLLRTHNQPELILGRLRSGIPLAHIASDASSDRSSASPTSMTASSSRPGIPVSNADSAITSPLRSSVRSNSSPSELITNTDIHTHSVEEPEPPQLTPSSLFLNNRHRLPDHGDEDLTRFPPAGWTSVTTNDKLVDYLLEMYFCWEYPTFASLSKEHFISDFNSGTQRFCSALLVNAVLALGARSSDAPEARKNPIDPRSAGEHFFEEAKRLLGSEEVPTLATIQALGLMSLRQASYGKDASSVFYARQSLRMALDIDLHCQHPASRVNNRTEFSQAEREVRTATFWGCFNLEQAWSLCIGRPSQVVPGEIGIGKPTEIDEIEHEDWKPCTDTDTISKDYHQPNNVRSVYRAFSELSEIINQGEYHRYSRSHQLESHKLLSIYHKLLEWYDALPDQLRLGINFTPTVLFTHMYYHFAVLMFFRPFRDQNITESTTSPRKICTEAAQNLFALIKSYKDLYTLRRVPSFVPYMILTANLAYVVDLADEALSDSDDLASLSYLQDMCSSHYFAERALDIVDYFSEIWGVQTRGGDSGVRLLRERLRKAGHSHPAHDVPGTDTFFLPGLRGEYRSGEGGQKQTAGASGKLFPQQASRLGWISGAGKAVSEDRRDEDEMDVNQS